MEAAGVLMFCIRLFCTLLCSTASPLEEAHVTDGEHQLRRQATPRDYSAECDYDLDEGR